MRIIGSVALLVPLLWVGANLFDDLHARPTGRTPVSVAGARPPEALDSGTVLRIPLAPSRERYRAIVLRAGPVAPPRRLLARTCLESRCVTAERDVEADGTITLAVPEGTRGGTLELSILRVDGPGMVLHDRLGYPALEAVRGYSWSPSLERAREVARAMAGVDLFSPAVLAYGAGLLAALAVALACAASPSARSRAACSKVRRTDSTSPDAVEPQPGD
jgi:hypothetical protein